MRRKRFTPTETTLILRIGRAQHREASLIKSSNEKRAFMSLRSKGLAEVTYGINAQGKVERYIQLTNAGRKLTFNGR